MSLNCVTLCASQLLLLKLQRKEKFEVSVQVFPFLI